MVHLKRNLLSVALATAAMVLSLQVQAQNAGDTTQEAPEKAKKKGDDAKNLTPSW